MAEDKKKEKDEAAEGAEAAAKPKSKKKLIIIVAAVLVLGGGGAAFALMGGSKAPAEGEEHAQAEEEHKHYATAQLDTIIVNLSENSSFLKVKMTLEYDPEIVAKAEGGAEGGGEGGGHGGGGAGGAEEGGLPHFITAKEAFIRDAIITVLSSKTPAEVLSVEGKETIKEELIEAINGAIGLEEGPIVNVYFNEFLVQ